MKPQDELIALLKRARKHFPATLDLLLPEPMVLSMSDHSTGCQARIFLQAEGLHTLDVWYGSVWYSSTYEFNDRGKTLGMQPDMEFAQEAVESFFASVQATVDAHDAKKEASERSAAEEGARKRQASIDAYKQMLGVESAA